MPGGGDTTRKTLQLPGSRLGQFTQRRLHISRHVDRLHQLLFFFFLAPLVGAISGVIQRAPSGPSDFRVPCLATTGGIAFMGKLVQGDVTFWGREGGQLVLFVRCCHSPNVSESESRAPNIKKPEAGPSMLLNFEHSIDCRRAGQWTESNIWKRWALGL